jgi:hypothetical protein
MTTTHDIPALSEIMAYKGLYALCTVKKETSGNVKLKATHYACCLVYGSSPIWGVWTVNGRFQRFFSYKSEIAGAYPSLVWRRKAASWSLSGVEDLSVEQRRARLETRYRSKLPERVTTEGKDVRTGTDG